MFLKVPILQLKKIVIMDYKELVKKKFKNHPDRLKHTMGVLKRSLELGKIYNADLKVLEVSSLLHDITKYESFEFHKKHIKDSNIIKQYPGPMLHAFSASEYVKELNVTDEKIIDAIKYHIFGKIDMSPEIMILVVSDFSEENRTHKEAKEVYKLSLTNLKEAYLLAMESTIKYLKNKGIKPLDKQLETYYYYKKGDDK